MTHRSTFSSLAHLCDVTAYIAYTTSKAHDIHAARAQSLRFFRFLEGSRIQHMHTYELRPKACDVLRAPAPKITDTIIRHLSFPGSPPPPLDSWSPILRALWRFPTSATEVKSMDCNRKHRGRNASAPPPYFSHPKDTPFCTFALGLQELFLISQMSNYRIKQFGVSIPATLRCRERASFTAFTRDFSTGDTKKFPVLILKCLLQRDC